MNVIILSQTLATLSAAFVHVCAHLLLLFGVGRFYLIKKLLLAIKSIQVSIAQGKIEYLPLTVDKLLSNVVSKKI